MLDVTRIAEKENKFAGTLRVSCAFLFFVSMSACVKSPSPVVDELIKIEMPTFDFQASSSLTVASQTATLNGHCDPKSYGLQYAIDQTNTWTEIPGGCNNGTFSFTIPVHRIVKVYARAKTKLTYTQAASLVVHYVPAPTSTTLSLVASSSSDDDQNPNMQSAMGHTFTGEAISNGTVTINSYLPGMTYAH